MKSSLCPLGFGGINVSLGSHIAAFYRDCEEQRAVTVPFIRAGLERGARYIYIFDEETRDGLVEALQEVGVDTEAALASSQLSILTAEETYLSQGYFSPEKMLDFSEASLRSMNEEGYQEIRVMGEMTWMLQEKPGVERVIEYEARLNKMLPSYPQVTICQYNVTRLRGDVILDALKTHPACILGGVIIHNHFFVSPDKFLRELGQRSD